MKFRITAVLLALLLFTGVSFAQDKATRQLSLTVNAGTVSITTASLPGGMVGLFYTTTVVSTGGLSPYTFSVTTGSLPAGLSLAAATGIISGTPTSAGSSTFTLQAADSETPSSSATQSYTVSVVPALAVTTTTLPAANIGAAYTSTLAVTGGVSPYTWAVTTGSLPAGLTLSSAGVISGTPTAAGTFTFTVTVTDSGTNIVKLRVKTMVRVL